ncbi:hypothetical protein CROQUDRAFT_521954 [Cronartium quercuum f. sp. fusiforme G11]|uniref:Uncharacterized protein n=1 Tax=Cronartium quercuum f. sp. fusiforme G11 TaxID=708437 RepID=A0A9P6NLX3_9BASI|nr:hypothetical protein CROQUDRAFT_521954 [Cronartium quercuum f. sp. fusiforme G11]
MLSRYLADELDKLENGQAAVIFQVRSGCNALQKDRYRIKAEPDADCEHWPAIETLAHFLIYVLRAIYTTNDRQLKMILRQKKIRLNLNSATALLDDPRISPT